MSTRYLHGQQEMVLSGTCIANTWFSRGLLRSQTEKRDHDVVRANDADILQSCNRPVPFDCAHSSGCEACDYIECDRTRGNEVRRSFDKKINLYHSIIDQTMYNKYYKEGRLNRTKRGDERWMGWTIASYVN